MRIVALLILCAGACLGQTNPETASFPSAVVTHDELTYFVNGAVTTLAEALDETETGIDLTSAADFIYPSTIAICPIAECNANNFTNLEFVRVTNIVGNTLTVDRGFAGSSGIAHSLGESVQATTNAYVLNKVSAEVLAIETALGANLSNVVTTAAYGESFSAVTSVTMTNAEHGIGHANLIVQCYDNSSPRELLAPQGVTVNSSTFEVVVTFALSSSGTCVVAGNAGGTNSCWTKYTIDTADLNDADTSEDETLFTASQYEKIRGVTIKHSTAFSGTGVTALTASVGATADPDFYASAFDVFQTAGDTVFQDSLVSRSFTMAAAGHAVIAQFNSTGGNLSALTAGSVDIWVCSEVVQ